MTLILLLLVVGYRVLRQAQRGHPHGQVDVPIVLNGLIHNVRVHLPQDDRGGLSCHVAWPDAMLDPVGGVGTFLHHTDAASRERDREGAIAVPIELASKGEPRV